MSQSLLSIAIIPNKMLGDGIISLVLANNLHQNGFRVTVFHDYLLSFRDWLDFTIMSSDADILDEARLQTYDIVLADTYSSFTERYSHKQLERLARSIIFFSSGRLEEVFYQNHQDYLNSKLSGDKARYIPHFAAASRKLKRSQTHSMVENMVLYCTETLKLPIASSDTGLKPPVPLIFRKHPQRIILSPTSSEAKKEWPAGKFIALAKKLKSSGLIPVFSCAPDERKQWLDIIKHQFEMPAFDSVETFAKYIYESGFLIANDSGSGHLASALGIPVLTIVTSPRKRMFRWRPGWGKNQVITPFFTCSLSGKRYWRLFLPVNRVYKTFIQMYKQN